MRRSMYSRRDVLRSAVLSGFVPSIHVNSVSAVESTKKPFMFIPPPIPEGNLITERDVLASLSQSDKDSFVSTGFVEAVEKNGWLPHVSRNVFLLFGFERDIDKQMSKTRIVGSAVVLSQDGTFVTARHVSNAVRERFALSKEAEWIEVGLAHPEADKYKLYVGRITAKTTSNDLVFGKIQTSVLPPVVEIEVWGQSWNETKGENIVNCGYPGRYKEIILEKLLLHSSVGRIVEFTESISADTIDKYPCQLLSTAFATQGMSGGGAFINGKLAGILSGMDDNKGSAIVPSCYIASAYEEFSKKGLDYSKNFPDACLFRPGDLEYLARKK